MKKNLPIGIENFRELFAMYNKNGVRTTQPSYYVDKTLLVKEILDRNTKVTLYTRPRRFGKSLNISMLQYYFENLKQEDAHIFQDLKISKAGEFYKAHQNNYPVIQLTLDSVYTSFNHCIIDAKITAPRKADVVLA